VPATDAADRTSVTSLNPPPDTSWARSPLAVAAREVVLMGPLRALTFAHNRPRVLGREFLHDLAAPVLFAANHASHLDTPVIFQSLPGQWRRRTSVVAAMDYFFKRKTTGWVVSLMFATIPIERSGVSRETQRRIDRLVADGWNLLMYPEGTRSRTGLLGPLRAGCARLAIKYDIPIVPVYLTGTYESHPKGSNWPTPHKVEVRFGKLLPIPADRDHQALTERLRESFRELAAEAGRSEP
jgi:1-acyl-sn-glycerol-3-phosphate acyltransferase